MGIFSFVIIDEKPIGSKSTLKPTRIDFLVFLMPKYLKIVYYFRQLSINNINTINNL